MNLEIRIEETCMRCVISEGDSWTSHTFFIQVDAMTTTIREAWERTHLPVLFDFSALDHIDSTLVSALLQTVRIVQGQRVSCIASHEDVRGILELLGIDKITDLYDSEQAWRTALKKTTSHDTTSDNNHG